MNRFPVRLMHSDPKWRQEFRQSRSSILQSCAGWVTAVEHIGSTAIGGLIARPTIDMLAGIHPDARGYGEAVDSKSSNPIGESTRLIEGLNFRVVSTPDWASAAIVLDKPRHGWPTHRVFLMPMKSVAWNLAIAIRDRLLADPDLATRFELTKVTRWRSGEADPDRYHRDKSIFFTHLIDQLGGRHESTTD